MKGEREMTQAGTSQPACLPALRWQVQWAALTQWAETVQPTRKWTRPQPAICDRRQSGLKGSSQGARKAGVGGRRVPSSLSSPSPVLTPEEAQPGSWLPFSKALQRGASKACLFLSCKPLIWKARRGLEAGALPSRRLARQPLPPPPPWLGRGRLRVARAFSARALPSAFSAGARPRAWSCGARVGLRFR